MKIQSLDKSKKEEVLKLCRLSMHLDNFTEEIFDENTFGDEDFDPELTLTTYNENEPVGFIMGVIRNRGKEKVGYVKLLCVHPEFRRKGIASDLYNKIEEKFINEKIKLIRVYESYPNYYMPGIDPFYTEAVCFFERNEYKKFNDTSNLEADLTNQNFDTEKDEEKLIEEGFEIRRATERDFEDMLNWTKKNFEAWMSEVKRSFKNDPVSLHIAKKGKDIIAFSAYEANNVGTGWFGPMGTTEKARGKGIGGILLKRCLSDMKNLGFKKAIIPWVGPIPFYMHYANSKVKRIFWRYEKIME